MRQPDGQSNERVGRRLGNRGGRRRTCARRRAPQHFDKLTRAIDQEQQADERRGVRVPAPQCGRSAGFADLRAVARGDAPVTEPHRGRDKRKRQRPDHNVDLGTHRGGSG